MGPEQNGHTRPIREGLRIGFAVAAIMLSLLLAAPLAATATEPLVLPLSPPGSEAWQPLIFRSIERQTDYQVSTDPSGRPAYRAVSDCGASALRLALPADLDLARTPRLAWRWRLEQGLRPSGSVRIEKSKAGDDFAARVYVLFEFDAEAAGFMARMERSLGRRLFGVDLPGKTINYVWTSQIPVGEVWTSPHHDDARLVAVETSRPADPSSDLSDGEPEESPWRETIVHLAKDAGSVFDSPLRQRPYALALMVDADDRCEKAVAWFSDFRLLGPLEDDPTGEKPSVP